MNWSVTWETMNLMLRSSDDLTSVNKITVSYKVDWRLTNDHMNSRFRTWLIDRLSNRCKFIELTFFSLSVFNAKSCRFFLLSFNSLVEQMIDFVKHFHNRLLTRRVDDRIRIVEHFYSLNAIESMKRLSSQSLII